MNTRQKIRELGVRIDNKNKAINHQAEELDELRNSAKFWENAWLQLQRAFEIKGELVETLRVENIRLRELLYEYGYGDKI